MNERYTSVHHTENALFQGLKSLIKRLCKLTVRGDIKTYQCLDCKLLFIVTRRNWARDLSLNTIL